MNRWLLLAAYGLLILTTLSLRPLWVDELNQIIGTRGSTSELLQWSLTGPGGAPLAYFAQQWSFAVLGFSTVTARLPAALFGIASVAMFYALARQWRILHPLAATVLFAFLPVVLRYNQEARPYSQALFFSLLTLYAWPAHPWLLGVACLLGLYTQPFTVFPALALLVISLTRREWRSSLAPTAAMVAFVPWLILSHDAAAAAHTMAKYFFSWKQVTPLVVLRELAGGGYWVTLALLALASYGWVRAGKDLRTVAALVLAISLAGPIFADAAAHYFFASRQLLFALPVIVLLSGFALDDLAARRWTWSLAALLFAASLVKDLRYPFSAKEDWAAATRALAAEVSPDACILVAPPKDLMYFGIYDPSLPRRACPDDPLNASVVAVTTPYSTVGQQQVLARSLPAAYREDHATTAGGINIRVLRRE